MYGAKGYTEEDYYKLPEEIRAELIDGQFYYMAAPSRIHQKILMELSGTIRDYLKSGKGSCEVYPAPFAVKLFEDKTTIVEPDISVICEVNYIRKLNLYANAGVREYWIINPQNRTVLVYFFEEAAFEVGQYTFQDKIKVDIYDDLWIDFAELI